MNIYKIHAFGLLAAPIFPAVAARSEGGGKGENYRERRAAVSSLS